MRLLFFLYLIDFCYQTEKRAILKLLIVSALQIYPPLSGGNSRTAALASSLEKCGCDVTIYSLIGRKQDLIAGGAASESSISSKLSEYVVRSRLLGLAGILAYRLGWPPYWATARLAIGFYPTKLRRLLKTADAVVADFPFTSAIFWRSKKTVLVLNTHNVEHKIYTKFPWFSVVRALEVWAARTADVVLCCSETDALFINSYTNNSALIVPNGVETARFVSDESARKRVRDGFGIGPDHCLFLFSASAYGPNIEAFAFLSDFAEKHEKLLIDKKITFLVVGSVSKHEIRRPGLIVTGRVAQVEPYFNAADAAINPIFKGSGTSVKLAEFIAAKLPVLTTETGARGFRFDDKIHGILFDENNLAALLQSLSPESKIFKGYADRAFADNQSMIDMQMSVGLLVGRIREKLKSRRIPSAEKE